MTDRELIARIARSPGGKAGYKQLVRELGLAAAASVACYWSIWPGSQCAEAWCSSNASSGACREPLRDRS